MLETFCAGIVTSVALLLQMNALLAERISRFSYQSSFLFWKNKVLQRA
jgi:energy-converting hydrogenase Eha subunit A